MDKLKYSLGTADISIEFLGSTYVSARDGDLLVIMVVTSPWHSKFISIPYHDVECVECEGKMQVAYIYIYIYVCVCVCVCVCVLGCYESSGS